MCGPVAFRQGHEKCGEIENESNGVSQNTHTYSALWSYKIVGYKNPVVCVCTSEWSSESNTVQHVDVNRQIVYIIA